MEQSLCILGRQPAMGLAELESLYGAEKVRAAGTSAALLGIPASKVDFSRLGGSTRLCKVLTVIEATGWQQLEKYLTDTIPQHVEYVPAGKLQLGLSVFGMEISVSQLGATGLKIKKVIRATGRSVRLIPNKNLQLNTGQVTHNHLTGPTGWELVLVRDKAQTILAQTIEIQDIASYTLRDRGRPKRDPRVGMLPPKLAQIIINLAAGFHDQPSASGRLTILDPFCGTGVMLQEALLMDYDVYGTDIDSRMIDYSGENLDWLDTQFELPEAMMRLEQGDATNHRWDPQPDLVASEAYLGRPFTSRPRAEVLNQTVSECNVIIKKFLQNIATQIPGGTRLCLAVPAWQIRTGDFKHLPLIDQLSELGYNRVSFKRIQSEDLLYYREGQIVARELLILTRK